MVRAVPLDLLGERDDLTARAGPTRLKPEQAGRPFDRLDVERHPLAVLGDGPDDLGAAAPTLAHDQAPSLSRSPEVAGAAAVVDPLDRLVDGGVYFQPLLALLGVEAVAERGAHGALQALDVLGDLVLVARTREGRRERIARWRRSSDRRRDQDRADDAEQEQQRQHGGDRLPLGHHPAGHLALPSTMRRTCSGDTLAAAATVRNDAPFAAALAHDGRRAVRPWRPLLSR